MDDAGGGAATATAAAAGRGQGEAAASRIVLRAEICLLICPPQGGELSQFTVTTILMASGGLLIANSNASAARASGKWCEKTWARAARLAATRRIACGEIFGRRAARADDVYFLFREGARPQRRRPRGQADDHDPAGRRRHLDRLGQHAGLAAGLDDERRPLAAGPLAGLRGQVVRRSPGHDLGAEALGQVAAAGHRVDRQHPRAGVDGRDQRGQADRPGAEHHDLLAGPQPAAGQRVHGHRGGLDEARAVRVQVAGPEDQAGRDLEPFGQAAVEVHADQAEGRADVGPPDAAGIAAAARQQRPGSRPARPRPPRCPPGPPRSRTPRGPGSAGRSRGSRRARPRHRKTGGSRSRRYPPVRVAR